MASAQLLRPPRRVPNRAAAWLVHLYTASGALFAFASTAAVFDSRYRDAFLLMGATSSLLLVISVGVTVARQYRRKAISHDDQ